MGLKPQPVMQRHFDAASQGRLSVDEISRSMPISTW
jgi:hypothetical protein